MTTPLSPEVLVPRLGEYLVQQEYISEDELQKALSLQMEKRNAGERMLLGDALIALDILDRSRIDKVVTEQIIQLRNALEESNRTLELRVQERTAELEEAMRKLSELSQLKANFMANVSHELRTPLTHIKGYLELLSTESLGDVTDDQKNALQVSQRATLQLESLIDNLIMFSIAGRGEMTLNLEPVDLTLVTNQVIQYSMAQAQSREIIVKWDNDLELPTVQADREKISWAVLQLLDNAIKFTPNGGSVTLSMHRVDEESVQIAVEDTGIGIASEKLQEIFEPFHQLDSSAARRYGGTGIGLALVKDVIIAHGANLDVHSRDGKGSVFSFILPVSHQE